MKTVAEVIDCPGEELCALVLDYETAAQVMWLVGNVVAATQRCAELWQPFHETPAVAAIFAELDEHTSRDFSEDNAVMFKRTR